MNNQFKLYVADCETTGLDPLTHEIIEISIYRINDQKQKTWFLRPNHPETASPEALHVNGHKIEDLKGLTVEGKEKYLDTEKAIIDIENFFMEDFSTSECRCLIGQNIQFDLGFIEALWKNHNAFETFPLGPRPLCLDTKQIQILIDLLHDEKLEYYNLGSLVEKYGVKKEKAHIASGDTRMTKDVFLEQIKVLKK